MLASCLGLHEGALENLVRESVALDVHLCGCETVLSTCCLEVHVAEVVFVAEDVGEDGVFVFTRVLDESHGNTCYRVLDGYTSVHEGECACTSGGHG